MSTFVLMAGLPGTGKSTLAEAVAKELGGIVLSKDVVRAALFRDSLTDYTREQDDLCFGMVLDAARYLAESRGADYLFLDGRAFSRRDQIEEAIRSAERAGCDWKIVHAVCPDDVAEDRLRRDITHPATNRSVELYREIKARFEPITEPHLLVDTSQPIKVCIAQIVAFLG
jgi:predicted kinase